MRNLTKKQGLREEAKLVMWNYYKENKDRLPKWIRGYREEILNGIIGGRSATEEFGKYIIEG